MITLFCVRRHTFMGTDNSALCGKRPPPGASFRHHHTGKTSWLVMWEYTLGQNYRQWYGLVRLWWHEAQQCYVWVRLWWHGPPDYWDWGVCPTHEDIHENWIETENGESTLKLYAMPMRAYIDVLKKLDHLEIWNHLEEKSIQGMRANKMKWKVRRGSVI